MTERDLLRDALTRLASWDEMAGNGDPSEFPTLYRQEIAARINTAKAALAAVPAHTPGALDVGRVKHAIQAVAKRHRIVRDPIPPQSLMSIFGYSAAPADMDAEIAAAYEAASPSEETR